MWERERKNKEFFYGILIGGKEMLNAIVCFYLFAILPRFLHAILCVFFVVFCQYVQLGNIKFGLIWPKAQKIQSCVMD